MKNTDLFTLFSLLSTVEFTNFEFYLKHFTPISQKGMQLYQLIKTAYELAKQDWKEVKLEQTTIEKTIYGKQKNNSTFRTLRSELLDYLEEYCAFLELKKEKKHLLIHFLAKRNHQNLFSKTFKDINKVCESNVGLASLKTQSLLWESYQAIEFKNNPRITQTNFNAYYTSFTDYSLIKRMFHYCILWNRKLSRDDVEIDPVITKEIHEIAQIASNKKSIGILGQAYKACIEMLEGNIESYYQLKMLLLKQDQALLIEDKKILAHFMYSFCLEEKNKNSDHVEEFKKEVMVNYFYRYEQGFLMEDGFIPVLHVKNLCTYAAFRTLRNDDFAMTKADAVELILKTNATIAPQYRISCKNHNLALLHFYNKDFKTSIDLIKSKKQAAYFNPYFKYDDWMILLRSFYELDIEKEEELLYGIRSFKAMLDRENFLPTKDKKTYYNFIFVIKTLDKIRRKKERYEETTKLEQQLGKYLDKPLKMAIREWALQKIEELDLSWDKE